MNRLAAALRRAADGGIKVRLAATTAGAVRVKAVRHDPGHSSADSAALPDVFDQDALVDCVEQAIAGIEP